MCTSSEIISLNARLGMVQCLGESFLEETPPWENSYIRLFYLLLYQLYAYSARFGSIRKGILYRVWFSCGQCIF